MAAQMGGVITAAIHHAAETHLTTDPTLAKLNQPDLLTMHIDFLYPCKPVDSIVTITVLKTGKMACNLRLDVTQDDKLKVTATAVSTNFDVSVGPSHPTSWTLLPTAPAKPDLDLIAAGKPEPNWVSFCIEAEILPIVTRFVSVVPRTGYRVDGICDYWLGYVDGKVHTTDIALFTDIIPSMTDTLLRNNGPYDAHRNNRDAMAFEKRNPGKMAVLPNKLEEAMKSTTISNTLTLDFEFKKRLPKEGERMICMRSMTRVLKKGRLDLEVTMQDEGGELVCMARQIIYALPASSKFGKGKGKPKGQANL